MEHSKQLITVLISLFIALSPLTECSFSYAENNQSTWTYITDQATEANRTATIAILKAYLGARNFTMFYSYPVEKAIVSWNYTKWNEIAKIAGLSGLDDFNNRIAYAYNSNQKLKFYMDATGISQANTLYQAILQYYGVGENETKTIYNGGYFKDNDNVGCYVFYINNTGTNIDYNNINNYITKFGTSYKYDGEEYWDNNSVGTTNLTLEYGNNTINYQIIKTASGNYGYVNLKSGISNTFYYKQLGDYYAKTNSGYPTVIHYNNKYYLGVYVDHVIYYSVSQNKHVFDINTVVELTNNNVNQAAIDAAQAGMNAGIVAQGKAAVINTAKEGLNAIKDYLEDNDSTDDDEVVPVDDPITPPEIDDNLPQNPTGTTDPNPHQPTNWTGLNQDSNGNFNFTMPNLNVNWNLDFGENAPFPFSIPFDLLHFLQAFNTEPVTPHIEETITIANMDIDIDIDLEWLDDVAGYFRTFILLSYVIGLIIATRALFHIY